MLTAESSSCIFFVFNFTIPVYVELIVENSK